MITARHIIKTLPAGLRMRVTSSLLLASLLLLLLPSIEMKKSGRGRGLRGARHQLTRDRFGFELGCYLFTPFFTYPNDHVSTVTSHKFSICMFEHFQGKGCWASQQVGPLRVLRVDRISRGLCRLSGPTPPLHSCLTDLVQATQAPPFCPKPDQGPS